MALSPSAGGAELVVCQCWCCQLGQVGCAAERSVELERTCQDTSQEIQMLNERREIFSNAIEGTLKVQSRANERLHDHIIEEMKEVEHEKTEEALKMVQKKNDWWRYQNERDEARRLQGVGKIRKDGGNDLGTTKKEA